MSDTVHSARPQTSLFALMFGVIAAPAFWIAQLTFGYASSAQTCYGGDHPVRIASTAPLTTGILALNIVALLGAITGFAVSFMCWRALRDAQGETTVEGRARFMAIWGIFSSLAFFCAVVFGVIASMTVPLCTL